MSNVRNGEGFNDFNEEHAPQKGSQFKFGGPSCVVLTCSSCNGLAGRRFEARAARLGASIEAARAEVMYIRNDLQTGRLSIVVVDDQAKTATDLKTAFLVAFAALGYRFAFAPAVKRSVGQFSRAQHHRLGMADLSHK